MEKSMENKKNITASTPRGVLSRLCNCGVPKEKHSGCKSIYLDTNQPVDKPDLAIYSQIEQLSKGIVPSWDNSDILTNHWNPFRLMLEAKVTIHNLSATASAMNALIHYYISPFGIGTKRTLMLTKKTNIDAGQSVDLYFPLAQSTVNGDQRVGVHFLIEHPHDSNTINNFGSQVHDGSYTTESGRSFSLQIPVFNDSNFTRQINLSIMPTDLLASITPLTHNFAPFEQIVATLQVDVPPFLAGSSSNVINRDVTVVGRLASGELIGGATKLLRIDN